MVRISLEIDWRFWNAYITGTNVKIQQDKEESLEVLRHSTSHLMAQAVKELFPGAKVAIGPSIETGFYYDFDYGPGFTEDDLVKIEQRMAEIAKRDIPIERKMLPSGRRSHSP